jgi:tetratricopeptide (TPR) repeat protein
MLFIFSNDAFGQHYATSERFDDEVDQCALMDEAEKYYRKAIELKPDFGNAYLNLADLILKPDAKIVEEINKLSTSPKDLKRYDVLKAQRQQLFSKAMPLLEKAHQLDPKDDVVKSNLKSVYNFLEMTDKVKALKEEN